MVRLPGMTWGEESYSRKDENGNIVTLEEYEAQNRPTGLTKWTGMTKNDMKLYAICGVGFMIDAYDLFIINLVTPIWVRINSPSACIAQADIAGLDIRILGWSSTPPAYIPSSSPWCCQRRCQHW